MTLKSESIGALASALTEAQKAFPVIARTRTAKIQTKSGSSYSYSYADLSDIFDAVREPLAVNGLALTQPIVTDTTGTALYTMLMHSSGEWIGSSYPLNLFQVPQEMGSAITYARRYALTSMLGIATEEDNDAANVKKSENSRHGAQGEPETGVPAPSRAAPPHETPASSDNGNSGDETASSPESPVLKAKRIRLKKLLDSKSVDVGDIDTLSLERIEELIKEHA